MERVWRTHAAAAGCHIHLTLASADVDTPERMTAEECVSKYTHKNYPMTESDKLKLVDALTSGLRSNAIIVHYLPWGRFLLRWRTTAIAAAKLHAAGDAFRSSNSALPERFQQASLCYRSRQKTSNDGVKQHMDEVGSEYRRVAQIAVKDGNKTSGDNEAYRYQLSEWDLDELLIEGRVPDVRTAQFILAVLEAARNITLSPPLSARPALREPLSSQSTHSPSLVAGSSLSASSSSSQPSSLSSQCSPSYSPPSSQSTHSSSRMASDFLSACSTSYNLSPLSPLSACLFSSNSSPLSSLSCSANPSPVTPAFDGIDMELDDPFSPSRLSSSLDAWSPFGSPSRWPDAGPQKTTQSPASSDVSQSSVIPPEADMGSPTDDSERRKQGGAKRTSGGAEPARKRQSTFVDTYGDVLFGYGVENGAD